jgi:hypothetical protein
MSESANEYGDLLDDTEHRRNQAVADRAKPQEFAPESENQSRNLNSFLAYSNSFLTFLLYR